MLDVKVSYAGKSLGQCRSHAFPLVHNHQAPSNPLEVGIGADCLVGGKHHIRLENLHTGMQIRIRRASALCSW